MRCARTPTIMASVLTTLVLDVLVFAAPLAAQEPEQSGPAAWRTQIDLGLNPRSRTPTGSSYYSWEMGGMVTLGLGNNSWAGGENDSDAALALHVPGTTLSINGKTIVKDGKLVK